MDIATAYAIAADLQEKALLRDLADELLNAWVGTGVNPVDEEGPYRDEFLKRLEGAKIHHLRDLVADDQVMDAIFLPELRSAPAVQSVHLKVQGFLTKFPQLLDAGWIHVEGYVHDMMEEMKVKRDTPDAQVVLAQFRMGSSG